MATLVELEHAGALAKLEPGLPPHVPEERLIYVSPRLQTWIEREIHGFRTSRELSHIEQLAGLVEDFCSGKNLLIGPHLNMLHHVEDSMWKLKAPDLRVFGWFAQRDCFVAVCADDATRVKQIGLYPGYAGDVGRFREALDLDPPKFVPGEDPYGVVSNYAYP